MWRTVYGIRKEVETRVAVNNSKSQHRESFTKALILVNTEYGVVPNKLTFLGSQQNSTIQ